MKFGYGIYWSDKHVLTEGLVDADDYVSALQKAAEECKVTVDNTVEVRITNKPEEW